MEALLTSVAMVAIAEIGDKTQLLAIMLAARFKRPLPIIGAILTATLANHFLAALLGSQVAHILDGRWFRYLVAALFILMAGWALIPDTLDVSGEKPSRFGPFIASFIAFFMVEMGDKTQLATVALGARFHDVIQVTAGTTLGMMLANVPAVLLGTALIERIPLKLVRTVAAVLFLAAGIWLAVQAAAAS